LFVAQEAILFALIAVALLALVFFWSGFHRLSTLVESHRAGGGLGDRVSGAPEQATLVRLVSAQTLCIDGQDMGIQYGELR
jgi:hypothetical protein